MPANIDELAQVSGSPAGYRTARLTPVTGPAPHSRRTAGTPLRAWPSRTGLGTDFVLTTGDAPRAPEPPEPSRDLPAASIPVRCARLADLERGPCRPEIRAGIELLMDTGGRPGEIRRLTFDCLACDADGTEYRKDKIVPCPHEMAVGPVRFSSGGSALFSWRAWQHFGVRGSGR